MRGSLKNSRKRKGGLKVLYLDSISQGSMPHQGNLKAWCLDISLDCHAC